MTKIHKQLIIDVNLETLRRGCVEPGETCYLRGVGQVPVEVARQWADDAFVKAVIRDGGDGPNGGWKHRTPATSHRRRPLHTTGVTSPPGSAPRSGSSTTRARFPDARTPAWNSTTAALRAASSFAFGETSPQSKREPDNLRPLCVHHHRQRTHDGYELKGQPGNRTWPAPDGRVLFADHPKRRAPTINPDP